MNFRVTTAVLAITLTLPVAAIAADAPGSADAILRAVSKNLQSKDEAVRVKMIIIEASGSQKERDLEISRLATEDGQSVLVRLQSPADLRGMGLLSVTRGKQSDQWLYLPSAKQTRRILSGKRSANFLDSELSYEDMGNTSETQYVNQVLRTESSAEGPTAVIESKVSSSDSAYGRMLTWVPLKTHLASKVEYYDHSGALLKTTEMKNYKHFPNGIWRAQEVMVTNAQNHRATRLELVDLKFDRGLSAENFSPSALANP